jgi:hypothetical protein
MVELYISSCCCFVQSSNAEYLSKSEIEDQNGCRGGPQPASDGEGVLFLPCTRFLVQIKRDWRGARLVKGTTSVVKGANIISWAP